MQCDVTRCIIWISNKAEYFDKERSYKDSNKRSYIVILSDLCNATKKILHKFSFHRHFKYIELDDSCDGP